MNPPSAVAGARVAHARDAEGIFREVIDRATGHKRPLLVACAQRDLAHFLASQGRVAAAKEAAKAARAGFEQLGAKGEMEKLNVLLGEPDFLND